jgi:hypothetical protein
VKALTLLSYQAARAFGAAELALVRGTDALTKEELRLRLDLAADCARQGFDLLAALLEAMA